MSEKLLTKPRSKDPKASAVSKGHRVTIRSQRKHLTTSNRNIGRPIKMRGKIFDQLRSAITSTWLPNNYSSQQIELHALKICKNSSKVWQDHKRTIMKAHSYERIKYKKRGRLNSSENSEFHEEGARP